MMRRRRSGGSPASPAGCSGSGPGPAVLAALRALPTRQREVIALRVFLDLDIATTARLLGIAPGTVGAHLSRAVTTLRAALPLTPGSATLSPPSGLRLDQLTTGQEAIR